MSLSSPRCPLFFLNSNEKKNAHTHTSFIFFVVAADLHFNTYKTFTLSSSGQFLSLERFSELGEEMCHILLLSFWPLLWLWQGFRGRSLKKNCCFFSPSSQRTGWASWINREDYYKGLSVNFRSISGKLIWDTECFLHFFVGFTG